MPEDFPWTGKENPAYHPPPSPSVDHGSDGDSGDSGTPADDMGCLGCLTAPFLVIFFVLLCWSLVFGFTLNDRHFTFSLGCDKGFTVQEED